jgi:hypothetical protein
MTSFDPHNKTLLRGIKLGCCWLVPDFEVVLFLLVFYIFIEFSYFCLCDKICHFDFMINFIYKVAI